MTALIRARWGDEPTIVVVEPEYAPALIESIRAGQPVRTSGPVLNMGRMDCKQPSHVALAELALNTDFFARLLDEVCVDALTFLEGYGLVTTPFGAAGLAAVKHAGALEDTVGLNERSRVLAFMTEGLEEAA